MENKSKLIVGKEYRLSKEVKGVFEGTIDLGECDSLSFKPTTKSGNFFLVNGSILFTKNMEDVFEKIEELLSGKEDGKQ